MSNAMERLRTDEAWEAAGTPIRSMHHFSIRCRDPEETRRFYEDFLGLEFTAAIPVSMDPDGKPVEALQMFFRMTGGDFVTLFHVPEYGWDNPFEALTPMDAHFAMKVPSETDMMNWLERFKEANVEWFGPLDHDFVRSIYFKDPNGIQLEITYQISRHEEILEEEAPLASGRLADWTADTAERKRNYSNPYALTGCVPREGEL